MDPNTQNETVEAPANITAAELALRRASRRQAPSASEPAGEEQEQPQAEDNAQTSEEAAPPVSEQSDDTQEQETTEQQPETEETPKAGALDELIQSAIQAASTATDRQSAIKEMARRIAAIAEERDAERGQRQVLEAKLKATDGNQAEAPAAPEPDETLAQMDKQLASLENALNVIEANPDGYTYTDAEGKEHTLDADQLRQMKHRYSREAASLAARRDMHATKIQEEAAQTKAEADQQALVQYPWLSDVKAPETQLAIKELAMFPKALRENLRARPQFNIIMGRYITGLLAEQAKAKGKAPANPIAAGKKPASNGQQVPRVVTAPAAKATVSATQKQLTEARQRFKESGSFKDMAVVRKLERQIKSNAA